MEHEAAFTANFQAAVSGRPRLVGESAVLGRFLQSLNDFAREQYGFGHELSDYTAYNFAQVCLPLVSSPNPWLSEFKLACSCTTPIYVHLILAPRQMLSSSHTVP